MTVDPLRYATTESTKPSSFRAIHIGDSLHHDIMGAAVAGVDSVFITNHGVHRDSFDFDSNVELEENDSVTRTQGDHLPPPPPPQQQQRNLIEKVQRDFNIKQLAQTKQQKLLKTCIDLCEKEEGLRRPTYILEELKW